MEELKERNDWGREFSWDKCIKKEIRNQKKEVPLSKESLEQIFSDYYGQYHNFLTCYLTEDDYGRFICCSRVGIINEAETDYTYKYRNEVIVFLFDTDLNHYFYVPTDYYNYQDEFKAFKEQHHWNEPPVVESPAT